MCIMLRHSYSTCPLLENYQNSSSFLNETHDSNPSDLSVCQREGWLCETKTVLVLVDSGKGLGGA